MSASDNNKNNEFDSGNLDKTATINTLLETPLELRDQTWIERFLENVAGANFKLGNPEVVLAKDGFPYMQLESVHTKENFKSFVIDKQLHALLTQGFGIIINAKNAKPDWILSYGDIVNYELNETFYTDESIFSQHQENIAIKTEDKILVGQPSDSILPKYLRNQLRDFLKHAGVQNPKIMLIARNHDDETKVKQDLVFNFTPQQFADKEHFQQIGNTIAWFLPRHYSFLFIDETTIENGFQSI